MELPDTNKTAMSFLTRTGTEIRFNVNYGRTVCRITLPTPVHLVIVNVQLDFAFRASVRHNCLLGKLRHRNILLNTVLQHTGSYVN